MTIKFEKSVEKRILIGKTISKSASEYLSLNSPGHRLIDDFNLFHESEIESVSKMILKKTNSIIAPFSEFKPIICAYINPEPGEDIGNLCLGTGINKIKGFNFDASDMLSLIDPVNYWPFTFEAPKNIIKVDRIIALVGVRDNKATLVYARVDAQKNIIEDFAIEYCDPCPTNCPNQINNGTLCA